jgi:5-methylcytosine-specific restriction endonuclease McrA
MKFQLEPFHRDVSNADLIQDLQKVYASLQASGTKLTFRTYNEHGKFSASTIAERFGTWNSALKAAQISPTQEKSIDTDDLFDNMRAVWIAKGRQPVFRDMKQEPSQFTATTYSERFGGWRNALMEFLKCEASGQPEHPVSTPPLTPERAFNRKKTPRHPNLRMKFRVMRRDNFRCVKCGRAPATEPGLRLEIDHIVAWSKGGETYEENLQTLCHGCNRGKTDGDDRLNAQ